VINATPRQSVSIVEDAGPAPGPVEKDKKKIKTLVSARVRTLYRTTRSESLYRPPVAQLTNKFRLWMKLKGLFERLLRTAVGPYPKPDKSSSKPHRQLFKINFNIILHSMPRSLLFRFIDQNFASISHHSKSCCMTHQSHPIFYYVHCTSLFYGRVHILRSWIHQRKVVSPSLIFKPLIVKICCKMTLNFLYL
jgi:hypothetical protein